MTIRKTHPATALHEIPHETPHEIPHESGHRDPRRDLRRDPDSFDERVYAVIRQIPRGKVATYGQIARLVGAPRMARFVGFALHRNPYEGEVPCHRVVFADGSLAPGFAFGGPGEQRRRLEREGVTFLDGIGSHGTDRVDLAACQW